MDGGLLLGRIVLAAVFAVAGMAKLADREGSRAALREFGLPARLASPFGLLLPLAELTIAVLLILTPTARIGAIAALALLLAFMIAIGVNLARGRTPDCHCFGQLHSAPAGPATLLRNGVLAALAALVVWQGAGAGGPAVADWVGGLDALAWVVLVGGVIAGLVVTAILRLLLQLMQQNGRMLSALDLMDSRLKAAEQRLGIEAPQLAEGVVRGGLAVGERAPAFTLKNLEGRTTSLDALRLPGKPVVLVFTDPNCGPCTALLPDLSRWQHARSGNATVVLVSRGSEDANRAKSTEFGVTNILLQDDREVAELYRVAGTPSGVLVQPDGTIGSGVAAGGDGIRALVESIKPQQPATQPRGIPVGEPAPAVSLTDLEGQSFELADYKGEPTALLFWNPGCGFCQRMLDDLKRWEKKPPKGAPRAVLVSAGPADANREQGLRSPIGLEEGFKTGRVFGAPGTPSAVLLDADGNVASGVVVGSDEVMTLLRDTRVAREAALT